MRKTAFSVLAFTFGAACGAPIQQEPAPATDLNALRAELVDLTPEQAFSAYGHFRPLCDENGYPLVGNVNSKVNLSESAQVSVFCEQVRRREHLE